MRTDIETEELAAGGALNCVTEQRGGMVEHRAAAAFVQQCAPRNTALTGLAVAIPLALSLWTAIAVLVWRLLR